MISSLKIAGHTYEVKPFKGKSSSDLWGWLDTSSRTIHVNTNKGKSRDRAMTIFHESLHGIVDSYGINATMTDNEEEYLVRILELAVTQLFSENKAFTRRLQGSSWRQWDDALQRSLQW